MNLSLRFLFSLILCSHLANAQELERVSHLADHPYWENTAYVPLFPTDLPSSTEQKSIPIQMPRRPAFFNPEGFAIEQFRYQFCSKITQKASKEKLVINNSLCCVSEYAAATFSWDIISYAFVQAMNGKEADQIWYYAFNQACTNVAQQKIAKGLQKVISKNQNSPKPLQEFFKEQLRQIMAMSIVFTTKAFVFPVAKTNALALLKNVLAKK